MSAPVTIAELVVAADPAAWERAGFAVRGETVVVGSVPILLGGASAGLRIVSWALRGLAGDDLDGLPTERSEAAAPAGPASPHPNGVLRIDHVVAFSPDLGRTVPRLEAAGLDLRRIREEPTPAGAPRQAFFRLGEAILEVIEHPPGSPGAEDQDAPAKFYGLAFLVDDMNVPGARLGPLLGDVRDAVQLGRRIATVKRDADLGLPVAFLTSPEAA